MRRLQCQFCGAAVTPPGVDADADLMVLLARLAQTMSLRCKACDADIFATSSSDTPDERPVTIH